MDYLEQNELFKLAVSFVSYSHQSLFLTGKAGTGKTTFLKYIKNHCAKKIAVTAPTGVAAINAGGVTLHSFFQLPFGVYAGDQPSLWGYDAQSRVYNKKQLLSNLRLRQKQREVIKSLELLVIDEISMVRADLLDAVDTVLRSIRRRPNQAFGGVQLLLIGDLFQLPPVVTDSDWEALNSHYSSPFFFDATVLKDFSLIRLELKKIYRQSNSDFIHLLNQVRTNQCTVDDLELLHQSYDPSFIPDEDSGMITLTTHNRIADRLNENALNRLPGDVVELPATVKDSFPNNAFPADEVLRIKTGAQIMFIKNDKGEERRYYNGKIGVIRSIDTQQRTIEISFPGEADSLEIETEQWDNIQYEYDAVKDELKEKRIGSFEQFPIRLAWAVTIHKSQGLTFDKAVIDAGRSFAPGQVYVALSRLTSMEGLVLHSRILPESIQTDPRILNYSSQNLSIAEYQELLEQAQMNYAIDLLIKAYQFEPLQAECTDHYKSFTYRIMQDKKEAIRLAALWLDQMTELNKVGLKFQRTLNGFLQNKPYPFEQIKQRTQAAAAWFLEYLNPMIEQLIAHQEKMKGQKRIKNYLKDLQNLLIIFEQKKVQLERTTLLTEALVNASNIQEAMIQFSSPVDLSKRLVEKESKKPKKGSSALETLGLYQSGKSIETIAKQRQLTVSTITGHLISFIPTGEVPIALFLNEEEANVILETMRKNKGTLSISELKVKLNHRYDFNQIKAALMLLEQPEAIQQKK